MKLRDQQICFPKCQSILFWVTNAIIQSSDSVARAFWSEKGTCRIMWISVQEEVK